MQYARWSLVTLVFAVLASCSRQQNTPCEATQPESAAHVRDPHSTTADLAAPLCPARFDDSLESNGIAAAADKGVTFPVIVHSVEAELSDEARGVQRKTRKKKGAPSSVATSLIGLVVDKRGNPQSLCIWKSSGYGLDANAAKAVQQFTFNPATKNGKPVPYRITIEVSYWLYDRDP